MSIEPSDESFVAKYHRMKADNERLTEELKAMTSKAVEVATEAGKAQGELQRAYATIHTLVDLLRKEL